MPRPIAPIIALVVLAAGVASASSATVPGDTLEAARAFHPKVGYWDGKLGTQGSGHRNSPEVQMVVHPDNTYMLGLLARIICDPGDRPVEVDLHLSQNCPLGTDCGPYGIGFAFNMRFSNRHELTGKWRLDQARYPNCRIPKGDREIRADWEARPRLTVTPSTAAAGTEVVAKGRGYLPKEQVWVSGTSPLYQIGAPFKANAKGRFERRTVIHPNQYPGTYPDVYLFQRSCLTICWVKGWTTMTILP